MAFAIGSLWARVAQRTRIKGTLPFCLRKRAARNGRNPATGAALKIKASKAPAFKAGATLKAAVNGIKK